MTSYRLGDDLEPESILRSTLDPSSVKMAVPVEARLSSQAGYLEWRSVDTMSIGRSHMVRLKDGRSATGCLQRFVRLASVPDEKIARFAEKWGVLGLCEHQRPGVHAECRPEISKRRNGQLWWLEPLGEWRKYAARFAAMLRITWDISAGRVGRVEDWELIGYPGIKAIERLRLVENPYSAFAGVALTREFLIGSGLAPNLVWSEAEGGFRVRISAGGMTESDAEPEDIFFWQEGTLYSVLVAQLVAAVTRGDLSECGSCRTLFDWENTKEYTRRPRRDRNAYCSPECRSDAHRRQKSDYWHRKHGKGRRENL